MYSIITQGYKTKREKTIKTFHILAKFASNLPSAIQTPFLLKEKVKLQLILCIRTALQQSLFGSSAKEFTALQKMLL